MAVIPVFSAHDPGFCNHCGRPFRPARPWARFCSPRCRVAARRAAHQCVTEPSPDPEPVNAAVTHPALPPPRASEPVPEPPGAHSGEIAPIRSSHRRYGDHDIRDHWGCGQGSFTDDLPAFLNRRPDATSLDPHVALDGITTMISRDRR